MGILAGLLALLIGGTGVYAAVYSRRLRRRVLGWPTVRGRVTARAAIQPTDRGRMSTPGWRWAPDVRYVYRVAGSDYEGDKTTLPWSSTTSKDRVERFLATIPDDVDVRYDPSRPGTSCLYAPGRANAAIFASAGVFAFLFGAIYLISEL